MNVDLPDSPAPRSSTLYCLLDSRLSRLMSGSIFCRQYVHLSITRLIFIHFLLRSACSQNIGRLPDLLLDVGVDAAHLPLPLVGPAARDGEEDVQHPQSVIKPRTQTVTRRIGSKITSSPVCTAAAKQIQR